MLLPSIFGESLLDDWMDFGNVERKLYGRHAANVMKTDVHEHDEGYELDIDLPGFKKDEIKLSLENGYLSVNAAKSLDKDKKNIKGKIIRQERYAGSMQRSFYVGDIQEEEIKASMVNGELHIEIPKEEKKVVTKKTIQIA